MADSAGGPWRVARHILAVLAGFVLIAVLSIAADMALEETILPGLANAKATTAQWLFVVFYRAAFSIAGCALAAWFAPSRPMAHALALGWIGAVFSTIGLIVMWGVGPLWYPVALILIALPCGWAGGALYRAFSRARP